MRNGNCLHRRGFLALGGAAILAPQLPSLAEAKISTQTPLYGISVFGDLKYQSDFKHLEYVNPDAPKGGRIVPQASSIVYNQNFNTFDTLNMFVLRGNGPYGMGLTFASLMQSPADELSSAYAYVARSVTVSDDKLTWQFEIDPEAHFHDGTPISPADIVFSLKVLRDKGHENLASSLRQMESVEALGNDKVVVSLLPDSNISTVLTIVGCPIFSEKWWEGRDFEATLSEAPLGSGPYRLRQYSFGSYIEFERVPDHWAAKKPIMIGRYNFDRIRYEYYRDRTASFEAFKAGHIQFREEFTSRSWATDYNFPAIIDGRIKREEVRDETPSGGQAWFFNTRREKFADPRIRKAIGLMFDFEWTNANLMYNSYERSASFYEKTEYKATGTPDAAELAIMEPMRDQIPAEAFEEPYVPPKTDGSGRVRNLARDAVKLLTEAGCKLEGGRLLLPSGEHLALEFLDDDNTFEPHHNAFVNNLRSIGINATYRVVDASQYALRRRDFDFDMTISRFSMPLYPHRFIKQLFGSSSANAPGSFNLAGVANPAIDEVLEKIIAAETPEEFKVASRVMDRLLRAEHYFVFQWHKASHWLAYWDFYDKPAIKPKYDIGVIDTWWTRPDRISATGMSG